MNLDIGAEHQLHIGTQIAADILWDRVRPAMLGAEACSREWPSFLRFAFLASQLTMAMGAASRVLNGMRDVGQL